MSNDKLKKLIEHRDAILLAEIGALIHDVGKLHKSFIEQHAKEYTSEKKYQHGDVLIEDAKRNDELGQLAKKLRNLLEKCKISDLDSNLYEVIKKHHDKDDRGKLSIFLKFIIASDEFDSEEDRRHAKDRQSLCKTFKSSAFGYESEIDLDELEELRKRVYRELIMVLNTCDFNEIVNRRRELFNVIKECFSKTLGMTARSANDVTLWDHSYTTATIMMALVAYRILDSSFVVDSKEKIIEKKPFKIFAVGWNFFDFIRQSHKIPDIIGRIEILKEIKEEIKRIVEEKYALGNSIYEDDFGIYFLIPSILSENDLEEVKKAIFNVSNKTLSGILTPVFHLEKPDENEEFRIGRLLTKAINEIKRKIIQHGISLIDTPTWIESWKTSVQLPKDKLICNACGKGYYCRGDDEKICNICKKLRNKGRKNEPPQTVFIDEISWNPEKRRYENVCLLIAKFDLDGWLSGKFVQSLFIRKPDTTIADYYDVVCDYCKVYLLYEKLYNRFKELKEKQEDENTKREKLIKICDEFGEEDVKKFLKHIGGIKKDIIDSLTKKPEKLIKEISKLNLPPEDKKTKNRRRYIAEYIGKDTCNTLFKILKDFEFEEEAIINAYVFSKGDRLSFLSYLYQKPSSPSRLMRIWNNTKEFLENISELICSKVPVINECKIVLESIDLKSGANDLRPNMAYIFEIEGREIGEVIFSNENIKELYVITPHSNEYLLKNKEELERNRKEMILKHSDSKKVIAKGRIKKIEENIRTVRAYRIISVSPILFMAIIPAGVSLDIVKMIKEEYMKSFGKVFGKLPLHIGLIYFKRKMPIFTILDSASRMIDEFERLNNGEVVYIVENLRTEDTCKVLELIKEGQKSFKYKVKIPYMLGDGNIDYYHPYLRVEDSSDDIIEIKIIDDKTVVQKHILKIKKDDKIKVGNYYFDFEFLDSNIRRFDIGKKRKHLLFTDSTNKPKPYLLWDIDYFERLRKLIQKLGLTTTQIMNLYEMLMAKLEEWEIRKPPIELFNSNNEKDKEKAKVFEKLVENAIKSIPLRLEVVEGESSKGKISKEDFEFLKDSIMSGLFFDFVDLWHTILKKKFEEGEENV